MTYRLRLTAEVEIALLGVPNRPAAVVRQEGIQGLSLIERDDEVVVPWGSRAALNRIHEASYHEPRPEDRQREKSNNVKIKGILKGIRDDSRRFGKHTRAMQIPRDKSSSTRRRDRYGARQA